MARTILRISRIDRQDCWANPDALFLFGDNLERRGHGGQAYQMRGEPNTLGIPTKRAPKMSSDAFFSNDDLDEVTPIIRAAFAEAAKWPGPIVVPLDGLGTGLAELPTRSPKIYQLILDEMTALQEGEAPER